MSVQTEIVIPAIQDLGGVASGETPATSELNDAFLLLNQIVSSWSNEGTTCYNRKHYLMTAAAGTQSYTIGAGGTWTTTAWPVKIEGATAYYLNWRQGLEVVGMAEFALRSTAPKGQTQPLPELLGIDGDFPTRNARLFPVSSLGVNVELHTLEPLTAFANLAAALALPEGHTLALRQALVIALAPSYGKQVTEAMAGNAQNSKGALVSANQALVGAPPQQQQQG